jgi:glycosyltransferase involved in cell wall biosynthesis
MTGIPRILFMSTYPPQHCGIATFTQHLIASLPGNGAADACVAALIRKGESPRFGPRVGYRIDNAQPGAYSAAAETINDSDIDVVCLQHEYGLFAGEWGEEIVTFLRQCRKPVVATLHTILPKPNSKQRTIMRSIARHSRRLVSMANVGIDILAREYNIPRKRCTFIPHGVPEIAPRDRAEVRHELGLAGRKVILTFGLLSRGKGIEHMVDALPAVCEQHPEALYVVVGKTHPNIVRIEGESYRDELKTRARELGVSRHLRFVDRFVSDAELLPYLQACDVYVTPYLGRDQITSGTLSYAVAAGCAIVSTPYLYAEELLAGGRGRLAEFHSGESLAHQVRAILDSPTLRTRLMDRAMRYGRSMAWPSVGRKYRDLFREVAPAPRPTIQTARPVESMRVPPGLPLRGSRPSHGPRSFV